MVSPPTGPGGRFPRPLDPQGQKGRPRRQTPRGRVPCAFDRWLVGVRLREAPSGLPRLPFGSQQVSRWGRPTTASASSIRQSPPALAASGSTTAGKARAKGEPGGPEGDTPATAPPRRGRARHQAHFLGDERGEDVPLALGEFEGHGKWPLVAGRRRRRRSTRAHRKHRKNRRSVPTKKGQHAHGRESRAHRKHRKNRRSVPTKKGRRGEKPVKTGSPERVEEQTTGPDRKGTKRSTRAHREERKNGRRVPTKKAHSQALTPPQVQPRETSRAGAD